MSAAGSFSSRAVIHPDKAGDNARAEAYRASALQSAGQGGPTFDLKTLREFRDGPYRQYPGLANWWKLAERNTPAIVYELLKHDELRESAWQLMTYASKAVQDLDAQLADDQIESAARLLRGLQRMAGNRRLSIDCSRALTVLSSLKGKTGRDALRLLSAVRPARHPSVDGEPDMRISKPPEMKAYEIGRKVVSSVRGAKAT
jgi:hypothetical protein